MSAASRRGLLGSAAALLPALAGARALPDLNPDAELIAACGAYVDAWNAYEEHGGETLDERADPLWHRVADTRRAAKALQPSTLAGLIAMARAAECEARQPDGSLDFNPSFTGDWAERVLRGVLRIGGAA